MIWCYRNCYFCHQLFLQPFTFRLIEYKDVSPAIYIVLKSFSAKVRFAVRCSGIYILPNKLASEEDVTVKLTSNTGNRTGNNDAANVNVTLLNEVVIPADSTLEVFAGQKIVVETTDVITIGAKTASKLDATLSVMEIT